MRELRINECIRQAVKVWLLVLMLFVMTNMAASAQTFSDPGFTAETVVTLPIYQAVGLTFAPDGRLFVWQKNGQVRIVKNGQLLSQPFFALGNKVNVSGDRGLIGLALDPNFASNGYVYLLYVYEGGGNPGDNGPKTARLTRLQADPANPDVALANSEVVLLGTLSNAPCSQYAEGSDCMASDSIAHTIGTVRFAPDGKLLVGMGDGASPFFLDPLAFRAQNLNYYNGKLLRLNPDGTAPSDNPFYDGTNSVRSKVYAYGLRSPYRFGVHPTTGEIIIGDVGHTTWEELNRGRAANFGWPCYEGVGPMQGFQGAFPSQCASVSAVTAPLHTYAHATDGEDDDEAAVVGGSYYTATQFPPKYRGNFFFADYVKNFIRRVVFDSNNNVASIENFATNLTTLVSLELGPDGALYYLELETGKLRRIRFTGSAPVAVAAATRPSLSEPYNVVFSSQGTFDPDGTALTYQWEFGDGATSTEANPTHLYPATGARTYTARLTVTNVYSLTATTTVNVVVGSRFPLATILTPTDGVTVNIGDTVTFSGTGTDPDETLPMSALVWNVLLHHNEHVHPGLSVTGTTGSFAVENHGSEGTYFYELVLTVTDSSGLTDTDSIRVNLRSSSLPPPWTAAEVGSNGQPGSASQANGTFTVKGSGVGISGFSDGFYFVHQPLDGDGEIRARVVSVQNTAAGAKAGVMMRAGTAANVAHATISLSPVQGVRFDRRSNTAFGTTVTASGAATQPYWVRLVRSGSAFSSYKSANGSSWTLVGTASLPRLPQNTLVGLTVTSNTNLALSTAVFDNVTILKPLDGTGLKGEYFDLSNLTVLRFTQTDSVIDFDWDDGSPSPSVGTNDYAIRWTGQVKPAFTETYTFHTVTEGGVRLWVNGQLLIDDWNDTVPKERSGAITLTAEQKYDLRLEYKETTGTAAIKLQWSSPRQLRQTIPQLRLYPPN